MAMITIGAAALPNPKEYSVSIMDLDSDGSGRSESGYLKRSRLRAGVYKIEATFIVSKTQLKTITDALAPVSFSVTFFDPTTSSDPTKTMYAGDKAGTLQSYTSEASPNESMWELSISLIEY